MKKIFQTLSMIMIALSLSVALGSCGDDEEEAPAPGVTLQAGTSTSIVVDYNAHELVNKLNFSAVGDWSIDVLESNSTFEVTADSKECTWAAVDLVRGTTGPKSPRIYTTPNHTTSARYAVIRINSQTNEIKVHLTQKGMDQVGPINPTPNPGN